MKHIALETYCSCETKNIPLYCLYGVGNNGLHCTENKCEFFSYCEVENEIAFIGEKGIINDYIGFGGEMDTLDSASDRIELINLWRCISKNKMNEAYDEFMITKNKMDFKKDINMLE